MSRTLLVGHPKYSWREWVKANTAKGDLVMLDPANTDFGTPCRVCLIRAGKVIAWRLTGAIDPQRNPLAWMNAAYFLLSQAEGSFTVLFPAMRLSPVLRQMMLGMAQNISADRIIVPAGSRFEHQPWPIGAEVEELPEAFPVMVQEAQRRARWLELFERSTEHEVDLAKVGIEGARMGSGWRLKHADFSDWGEVSGGVLHVITDRELEEDEIARAMNLTHSNRLSMVRPEAYEGLVCSFGRQEGEDFGMGIIQRFDPEQNVMTIQADAVAPAPVHLLRIGQERVDSSGRETGPVGLWAV